MYDGDEFVKEVEADFIMWEINGRFDFGYNTTQAFVSAIVVFSPLDPFFLSLLCCIMSYNESLNNSNQIIIIKH